MVTKHLDRSIEEIQRKIDSLEKQQKELTEEREGLVCLRHMWTTEAANGNLPQVSPTFLSGRHAVPIIVKLMGIQYGNEPVDREDIWKLYQENGYAYTTRNAFMTLLRRNADGPHTAFIREGTMFSVRP